MNDDVFDRDDWWGPDGFLFGLREALNPVRIPYIVRQLRANGARSVLDVGCGGGYVSRALIADGFATIGVDRSHAAVRAAGANSDGRFVVADGHHLPFDDESFDGVVLSEVLEHVADPRRAFAEAARVVAPGGVVTATGPNRTFLSRLTLIWLAQEWPTRVLPRGLHDHAAFVRPSELRAWGEEHGLEQVDVTGVGVPIGRLPAAIGAVVRLRTGSTTYGEAGRRIGLQESRSSSVAYMACMRKTGGGPDAVT